MKRWSKSLIERGIGVSECRQLFSRSLIAKVQNNGSGSGGGKWGQEIFSCVYACVFSDGSDCSIFATQTGPEERKINM